MDAPSVDNRGLFKVLIGDGRPLLMLTALTLFFSGSFALFISARGEFLPHDVDFLGMTAKDLCSIQQCRIVHFMFHDRVSFGGVLISISVFYLWLATFPLALREAWAWWTLAISGGIGFSSFLTYLGYGYLDTWHGIATISLLPCFIGGMWMTFRRLEGPRSIRTLLTPYRPPALLSRTGIGRACVCASGAGLIGAGLTIMTVGMTTVFVPTDLIFMDLSAEQLRDINPNLIPLIAHDRAGFGGGVASCGALVFLCAWRSPSTRSLWQAMTLAGAVGFACAIGVHPIVGYNDFLHLAPAILGAAVYLGGCALLSPAAINVSHPVPATA